MPELVEVPYDVAAAVEELDRSGLTELAGVWGGARDPQALCEGQELLAFLCGTRGGAGGGRRGAAGALAQAARFLGSSERNNRLWT